MTENNFAEAQQHSAPVLTLHPEQEARQTVEKAVDMLEDLKNAPQAPDAKDRACQRENRRYRRSGRYSDQADHRA